MTSDHIFLAGMSFFGHHGVLPEERELGQRFLVDVDIVTEITAAGGRDDLTLTVDYRHVYETVRAVVEGPPMLLVEAIAERVAHRLLEIDRVEAVTVRVRKPDVALGGPLEAAGVEIRRRRDSPGRDAPHGDPDPPTPASA